MRLNVADLKNEVQTHSDCAGGCRAKRLSFVCYSAQKHEGKYTMYQTIFIANRADCAMRLIEGVHAAGARAVVAMAADDPLERVRQAADVVVTTGASREAFLRATNLIEAAKRHHCEAILPGWGFLSEDPIFAQQCRLAGIHYIGPSSAHLHILGDKYETLQRLCAPLGLNNHALLCSLPDFEQRLMAHPKNAWVLKRRTGGGGKGVFLCESRAMLLKTLAGLVRSERLDAFYAEPWIVGRHIEFQIFGDGRGCVKVLGIRDCTPQRRCQKWLERHVPIDAEPWLEPFVTNIERLFAAFKYRSWGTLETLVDEAGEVHLLEVNPRLQVEHGVTEMATGLDLVRMALEVECYGTCDVLKTWVGDTDPKLDVLEFRLFAEAPGPVALPRFEGYVWPHHPFETDPDYRLETGYMPGDVVSGVFDGLVARFIVRSRNGDADHRLRNWIGSMTGDNAWAFASNLGSCEAARMPREVGEARTPVV